MPHGGLKQLAKGLQGKQSKKKVKGIGKPKGAAKMLRYRDAPVAKKVVEVAKKKLTKKQRVDSKAQLYPEDRRLLLVGEGDFSFCRSLVKMRGNGYGIVATALDTAEQLKKKYKHCAENISESEEAGAVVLTGVDGTQLHKNPSLTDTETIIFNFPHTGCGIKDKTKNVALHKKLMLDFFNSAKQLVPREGEIHVTLKRGEPYDSWGIAKLARDAHLVRKAVYPFDPDMFPGYAHCKTAGTPGEVGDNSIIAKYGARIWVFVHEREEDEDGDVSGSDSDEE
eukprot:TRINITY_DN36920_c0_g1_i1.p1 TRINITY_DN36920_c0_g1~~TRINITY_DN36920_c0_g1_i1.p1  ORF type:complete len:281 (+),score=92.81 TRINITY_DN36920_c0_g1_i1:42-884(+)